MSPSEGYGVVKLNTTHWLGEFECIGDNTIHEPDRQCTYNVTVRRVRVTIVAVEKQ